MKISGTFKAALDPMDSHIKSQPGITLVRMLIHKTFRGGLEAISTGEMLSAMTAVQGSAGYVAVEQVVGRLSGKSGSFILQHFGIMSDGERRLVLEVVPDSGSGELTGLRGKMAIRIEGEDHYYDFDYDLP